MRRICLAVFLVACILNLYLAASAQTTLPIPDVRTMHDIPSAKELPDPSVLYKIVFDLSAEQGHENEANPNLEFIAGLVNTFAKYGVDQADRRFVVVLHGSTVTLAASDDAYKKLNHGASNPNRIMLTRLEQAGVQMVACGQSALSKGITPEMIDPNVQLDLSATIAFINLGMRGYVRIQE